MYKKLINPINNLRLEYNKIKIWCNRQILLLIRTIIWLKNKIIFWNKNINNYSNNLNY